MDTNLIPSNAKKSTLILGFFTTLDLIVFGIGITFTIIMLLTISSSSFSVLIMIILPALISGLLIMPVPHYHNVLQLLINIYTYLINQKNYKWKGWGMYE